MRARLLPPRRPSAAPATMGFAPPYQSRAQRTAVPSRAAGQTRLVLWWWMRLRRFRYGFQVAQGQTRLVLWWWMRLWFHILMSARLASVCW